MSIKIVVVILCAVLISSCYHYEQSEVLTERAEVVEVVYTPAQHGTGVGPAFNMQTGQMAIAITSVDIDEVHAVVFACAHGKFIIHRKDVWQRAKLGDQVLVQYREVYRVDRNGDRHLIKYDFIDFSRS